MVVLACVCAALFVPAVAAAAPTIISLTFDDGTADQYQARAMLAQDSLHATFYVNSDNIGSSPSFLTWDQLTGIAADGNEIAGHTLDHVDLTTVTTTEATRQVCDDRQALILHGFNVTDFAYPYGDSNSSIESIVQGCGYKSARKAWGLCNVGLMPPNCNDVLAEPVPPRNLWEIAVGGVHASNTLADVEGAVTRAEDAGGGWVVLLFHHVCDGCSPSNGASVSPAILSAFLDWLAPRSASGTYVRTMSDVLSDTTPPTSTIGCNGGSCSSWYSQPVSVSLSATDTGTAVTAIRYTTDGTTPTSSSPLYTGPFTVSTTTTVKYQAWDMAGNVEATNSRLIQFDTTPPVSAIACNNTACSNSTYTAAVTVSLSATDLGGSGAAEIHYETNGSDPTILSPLYTVPFDVSTTTTVKYRAWDNAGNVEATNSQLIQVQIDSTPPSSTIACNNTACSSSTYTAAVTVSLSATDPGGSGVAAIRYTTDGSDPTGSSTLYTTAFTVSATATVKYRAWDNAGNAEATNSQLIQVQIDSTPPSSTIACNNTACSSSTYTAAVTVSLSATDPGGSGVAAIRYTTDGSTPTGSSTLYTLPFSVSTTTTVKYRAWDNAGNAEATNSQLIQVDVTPPTSTIACNNTACSSAWYRTAVSVSLSASDPDDAVAAIRYTTDGSTPTSSSTLYTGAFAVSTTATVKYRAWDTAGNVEATKSQLIQIDTTPPTVTITSPANGSTVTGNIKIVAAPADAQSGIASVAFYIDGVLAATTTSSPWQLQWNVKKTGSGQHVLTAVAKDRAGNSTTSAAITVTVR